MAGWDILYGSRSADDLVQLKEIREVWMKAPDVNVYLTFDQEQEGWEGHVGFVPAYLQEIGFGPDRSALVCGPPVMIKFVLAALSEMGFFQRTGLHHPGTSDEVRRGKMRTVQHRVQVCM